MLFLSLAGVLLHAQESSDTILPPRPGLLPVELVGIDTLEEKVFSQLRTAERSLATTVADPQASLSVLAESYGNMGSLYLTYSLPALAEPCFFNARLLQPSVFRWTYLLGHALSQQGRISEAVIYWNRARILNPEYLATYVHLGEAYRLQGDHRSATEYFHSALELDLGCTAARVGLAQIALSQKQGTLARQYLLEALEQVPAANRLHYLIAMAYRQEGKRQEAEQHLAQSGIVGVRVADPVLTQIEQLQNSSRLYVLRGRMAYQAGHYEAAIEEFEKAAELSPESIAAQVNLGTALAAAGQVETAIAQFQKVLKMDSHQPTAHYNLGRLLFAKDEYGAATFHLESTLSETSHDAGSHKLLAKSYRTLGRSDQALPHFLKAFKLDTSDEDSLLEAVEIMLEQKEFAKADQHLREAHRRWPERDRTTHMLARFLSSCPDTSFRDGSRAVPMAVEAYHQKRSLERGETVAMAMAEAGKCQEASEWQRRLILIAEQTGQQGSLPRLSEALQHYEKGPPCQPGQVPREKKQ